MSAAASMWLCNQPHYPRYVQLNQLDVKLVAKPAAAAITVAVNWLDSPLLQSIAVFLVTPMPEGGETPAASVRIMLLEAVGHCIGHSTASALQRGRECRILPRLREGRRQGGSERVPVLERTADDQLHRSGHFQKVSSRLHAINTLRLGNPTLQATQHYRRWRWLLR